MSKKQDHPQVGYAILKSHAVALGDEEGTFLDAPPQYVLNPAVQDRQATRTFMRKNWWKMVIVGWFVVGLALTQMVVVNRIMGGSMGKVELTTELPMDHLMPVTEPLPPQHAGQKGHAQAGAHAVPLVSVSPNGPGRAITLTIEACPACHHHIRPAPSATARWFRHARQQAMLRFAEFQRSQIVQAMRARVLALLNRPIVNYRPRRFRCRHHHHHHGPPNFHHHHGYHRYYGHHQDLRHEHRHDKDQPKVPVPDGAASEYTITPDDGLVHVAAPEPTFATAVMPPDDQSPPDDGLVHPVEAKRIFKTTAIQDDDDATLKLHPEMDGATPRQMAPVS